MDLDVRCKATILGALFLIVSSIFCVNSQISQLRATDVSKFCRTLRHLLSILNSAAYPPLGSPKLGTVIIWKC